MFLIVDGFTFAIIGIRQLAQGFMTSALMLSVTQKNWCLYHAFLIVGS